MSQMEMGEVAVAGHAVALAHWHEVRDGAAASQQPILHLSGCRSRAPLAWSRFVVAFRVVSSRNFTQPSKACSLED